jgi:hypothetical protein
MGVTFDSFKCLWDYCIQQRGWNEYDTLQSDKQAEIRAESKERLFAYLMIKNSSSTTNHDTIQSNLLEAFIAKRDEYPVDRSEAVAILNKYNEKKPNVQAPSEGTAFTQKGKKNDKKNKGEGKSSDKKEVGDGIKYGDKKDYFADKTCYLCGKTGHGVKKCPKRSTKDVLSF